MLTLAAIIRIIGSLAVIGIGVLLIAYWKEILEYVKKMLEEGKEVVIESEWSARTKRLVVTLINKATGVLERISDTFVSEEELWSMVPQIYTEDEVRRILQERKVRKNAR